MDNIHFMRKTANIKTIRRKKNLSEIKTDLEHKSIGVFLHIFYSELANEIATYLHHIPVPIDIFVSTQDHAVDQLSHLFSELPNSRTVKVRSFVNRGRDVAPFFVGYGDKIQNYDFILKIHSKKSPHSNALGGWFLHCLDNLVGSEDVVPQI